MIECRDCGANFPKPVTRGRPPVKCPDCRAGRIPARVPAMAASVPTPVPSMPVSEPESEPEAQTRKGKPKPLISGFCNVRHAPDIHKLCRSCDCQCHAD